MGTTIGDPSSGPSTFFMRDAFSCSTETRSGNASGEIANIAEGDLSPTTKMAALSAPADGNRWLDRLAGRPKRARVSPSAFARFSSNSVKSHPRPGPRDRRRNHEKAVPA